MRYISFLFSINTFKILFLILFFSQPVSGKTNSNITKCLELTNISQIYGENIPIKEVIHGESFCNEAFKIEPNNLTFGLID